MKKILLLFFLSFYFSIDIVHACKTDAADTTSTTEINELNPSDKNYNITKDVFADTSAAYALIAGGSRGIGFAIAEALAKRGYNLVLVARHAKGFTNAENRYLPGLDDAKEKIEKQYAVHVEVLEYDLSEETAATSIAAWCIEKNIKLKMLCNVAGLGGDEDFLSLPLDSLRYMIHLNIESAMAMSLTLLPILEKNTPAYILNVASMAGFAPIPSKNIYSATKAAVISFSYALRYQLKDKNIKVSCLAPGPVYTKPSIVKETKKQLGWLGNAMAMKPERVGEVAVKKTLKGRPIIVPGTIAKILSGVLRILPKRLLTYVYGKAGDRSRKKTNQ